MNYRSCRPSKFILKGTPEELESLTAKKLLLIASHYTNVPFVCETVTQEECRRLSDLSKCLVLLVVFHNSGIGEDKVIAVATSRSMMKIIASAAVNGEDPTMASRYKSPGTYIVHEAMVDGWLSFVWNSVDLPFQAASLLLKDETISESEKEGIEESLKIALKNVETHLSKQKSRLPISDGNGRLSMVPATSGGSYSLADFSLAVSLHFMMEKKIALSAMSEEESPHLYRWKESVHAVLGLVSKAG